MPPVGPPRRSALHTTEQELGRAAILAPNFVPRNLDLPRLELASDWLAARSACHICIKQLRTDGAGSLKGTVASFLDNVLLLAGWRPAVPDNNYL